MKTYLISLLAAGILLVSFSNPTYLKSSGEAALPYLINAEKGMNNVKSVPLSTVGSQLEYIPLETNTDCLIKGVAGAFVLDSFIYVTDGSRILQFERNGKYLKQIGSAGNGPGEYARIADFTIDKNKREIYVLSSRMVLVYDFNGQFKRDFKIDFPGRQFILNDRNSIMFHPINISAPTPGPVYSWYITDRSGVMQTKMINTLKRTNRGLAVPTSPLYMFNGTAHLMEFGIDTLYDLNNLVKRPYAIFNLGKMKMDPDPTMEEMPGLKGKMFVYDIKEIEKSFFVKIWLNMLNEVSNCYVDKTSLEFTVLKENGFINDIDGGMVFWPKQILDDNILIDFADAFEMIKYMNNNQPAIAKVKDQKKAGQLKTMVKQLTETSNPVLILLRQKS